jgi:hypothetical protein
MRTNNYQPYMPVKTVVLERAIKKAGLPKDFKTSLEKMLKDQGLSVGMIYMAKDGYPSTNYPNGFLLLRLVDKSTTTIKITSLWFDPSAEVIKTEFKTVPMFEDNNWK